jgi:hypothetical protein
MKTKVYVLVCPISLKVRYIGITKEKYLSKRLGGHKFDSINRNGKTHHHNWIRSLYNKGTKPIIKLLTTCESWEEARKLEISLIKKYKVSHNLTNSYDEGKFSSKGIKSARVYFTKPIYLYDEKGCFIKEYSSKKELCKELNINENTAKKILSRKKRFGKNIKYKFQLSRVKVSNLPPLLDIGSRHSTSPLFK